MARNIENVIEWYTGDDTLTVTLSQQKYINRVLRLAKTNDAVQIVAKKRRWKHLRTFTYQSTASLHFDVKYPACFRGGRHF